MLLIQVEECEKCEFFEIKNSDIYKCNQETINNLEPGGVFNYYYGDIANCRCTCTYFSKVK